MATHSIVDYTNKIKSFFSSKQELNESYVIAGKMGAKNLNSTPYYMDSRTINGLTFTVNENDGSVIVNGTSTTSDTQFIMHSRSNELNKLVLSDGEYYLSGCPENGSENTFSLLASYTKDGQGVDLGIDVGEGCEFTVEGDNGSAQMALIIRIAPEGYVADNLIFYPMICDAKDTDKSWRPYAKTNKELTDIVKTMGYVTPEMFGAKGDGVTDDSGAFVSAIEQAMTLGKKVYLANNYYLGSKVTIESNSSLIIEGQNVFNHGYSADTEKSVIIAPNGFEIYSCVSIRNVKFKNYGVQVKGVRSEIKDCIFYYCPDGISLTYDGTTWHGEVIIDNNFFDHCTRGVNFIMNSSNRTYSDCMVRNNIFVYGNIGINGTAHATIISNNHIYSNRSIDLYGDNNLITHNYFDNNGTLLNIGGSAGTVTSVHNNFFFKSTINKDAENKALPVCTFYGQAQFTFNDNFINFTPNPSDPDLYFIKITRDFPTEIQYADNICNFNFIDLGNGHLISSKDSSNLNTNNFKSAVAASSDFSDFQTRIAAL